MTSQNLFIIHCGFYDAAISNGIYEVHINIPLAALDVEEAAVKIRKDPLFIAKKMHIGGIQEIKKVSGLKVELIPSGSQLATELENHLYRDL